MNIRPATVSDTKDISALIKEVAHCFTLEYDGKGAEEFFRSITPEAITGYITNPDFIYLVCHLDRELAGVVAVRRGKHLFHLFVAPRLQRRGIGRRLWREAEKTALDFDEPCNFTVNSTPHAVPFYERLGFKVVGPRREKNGIAFVPMQLLGNDNPGQSR